jgi:hypothetical protein
LGGGDRSNDYPRPISPSKSFAKCDITFYTLDH